MKRLACLILALALLLALTACGEPDPNAGVYVAQSCDYLGISVGVEEIFEGGLSIELKNGGRASMTMGEDTYIVRWKLDGENITISDASGEMSGTLADGTMVLDISGVSVTLIRSA